MTVLSVPKSTPTTESELAHELSHFVGVRGPMKQGSYHSFLLPRKCVRLECVEVERKQSR